MAQDLHGQVGIITGAAVGIGRGVAVALAGRGMNVGILDIDDDENGRTAEAVQAAGEGEVLAIHCDNADSTAVGAAVDAVATRFGRIDVLVNNAAVWLDCSLTGGSFEEQTRAFQQSVAICTFGAFAAAAAAVPVMRRTGGGGNIVNILTDHVKPGHEITGYPATGYDAAKFGLLRLTESWAVELAPHRIRVNGLCFGATDTPMLRGVSPSLAEAGLKPSDLGDAVLNVISHGPDGPTGQSWLFGLTGADVAVSRAQIAALAPA